MISRPILEKLVHTSGATLVLVSLLVTSCAAPMNGGGGRGTVGVVTFDQQEKKIINQATAVGAVSGAAAGAVLARNSDMGPLGGALIGGVVGGVLGSAVGNSQANQARQLRLENNQLRSLVAATRASNDKIAANNRRIAARLAEIRRAPKEQRSAMAKAELKSVNSSLNNVDSLVSSRRQSLSKLSKTQYGEVSSEVRRGENERAEMVGYRNELSQMSLSSN